MIHSNIDIPLFVLAEIDRFLPAGRLARAAGEEPGVLPVVDENVSTLLEA